MNDTEKLIDDNVSVKQEQNDGDFPSMGVDLIKRINFKVAFFIFILGLFIFSDIFIEILPTSYQDGTNCTNSYGTVVQMVILVILYIIIDLLNQSGIL
jgi:hypothetical protein